MRNHQITLRRCTIAAVAIAGLAAGTAGAQGTPSKAKTGAYGGATYGGSMYGGSTYGTPAPATPEPTPAPVTEQPQPYEQPMEVHAKPWYERWGLVLSLGGGVEGFTHNDSTGTDTGGNWDVRAAIGTKEIVGFEASYIGSAQSINAFGLDSDALLVGNGLQGAFRVNLITGTGLDFFGLVGLAWRHYDISNNDFNTSDVNDTDDVAEIPFGGGMQFAYKGFLLDARAEYRVTSYGDLFNDRIDVDNDGDIDNVNDNMDRWGVQANLGYQF